MYLFDAQGRIREETKKNGPTVPFGSQSRSEYKRDAQGAVTEIISYDKNGKVDSRTFYQPTLDRYGNWIRRPHFMEDAQGKRIETTFLSERTITYHDEKRSR